MIDAHIHAVNDHTPGGKPGVDDEIDLDQRPDVIAELLRQEMKAAGVTHALGMGRLNAPADDPTIT